MALKEALQRGSIQSSPYQKQGNEKVKSKSRKN